MQNDDINITLKRLFPFKALTLELVEYLSSVGVLLCLSFPDTQTTQDKCVHSFWLDLKC